MRSIVSELNFKQKISLLFLAVFSVLWICFIFSNSLKTAEASDGQSGRIVEFIIRHVLHISDDKLAESMSGMMNFFVRKLAHFTEFAVLSVAVCLILIILSFRKRICFSFSMILVLVIAVIDELLQTLSYGRACRMTDVLIDFCGGLFGCVVICLFCLFLNFKKTKRFID